MPHHLVLVRHAKSSWTAETDDHHRPLAGRGRRDARALGRHLDRLQIRPDLVWCSDAVRTRQTWELASQHGARAAQVSYDPQLYEADAATIHELVRNAPTEAETLLILGHNSGIAQAVSRLAAREGKAELWASLDRKFPTSACAVLRCPAWPELAPGSAELLSYVIPRG